MLPLTELVKRRFGRGFRPVPGRDVYLASYPRSGNTWLRALAFVLEMDRMPTSLGEVDLYVPDLHYTAVRRKIRKRPRYVVKTHEIRRGEVGEAIYIVRDPVSVLGSYFRYVCQVERRELELEAFITYCLCGRVWPGSWSEHALSWCHPAHSGVSVIRYEDMTQHADSAVEAFSARLGHTPEKTRSALAMLDIDTMKRLDANGHREYLNKQGGGWFVGSSTDADHKRAIRNLIERHRPETLELAARFGYDV